MESFTFRVKPFVEVYDNLQKASVEGYDIEVGYDNDMLDGKVSFKADGKPPQVINWKLSRSDAKKSMISSAIALAAVAIAYI